MRRRYFAQNRSLSLTAGWLFADLLLALGMLFLISSPPRPKLPPTLVVTPANLNPGDAHCTGGLRQPQCIVTIEESATSQGNMSWAASSDMSKTVVFQPEKGTLSPGKSASVKISAFPCQNGSFTFSGSGGAYSVSILWQCTPLSNDRILEHNYCQILLNIGSPIGFVNAKPNVARKAIESQLDQVRFLQGRQVGITIAYGGTVGGTEAQGTEVANQVYNVLRLLSKDSQAQVYNIFKSSSWYESLFTGLQNANVAVINVYLVARAGNSKDTCNVQHNPI